MGRGLPEITKKRAITICVIILVGSLVVFELLAIMVWAKVKQEVIETTVMQIVSGVIGALSVALGHYTGLGQHQHRGAEGEGHEAPPSKKKGEG